MAQATSSYPRPPHTFFPELYGILQRMRAKLSTKPNFIGPLVNSLNGEKKCIQLKQQFSCQRLSVMRISDVSHGLKVGELNIKSDEIKERQGNLGSIHSKRNRALCGSVCTFLRIRPRIDETTN